MKGIAWILGWIALGLMGSRLQAQPTGPVRSLIIEQGKVLLDGRPVTAAELPAELQTGDVSLHVQFSGEVSPVFAIKGQFFRIEGDRLVSLTPAPEKLLKSERPAAIDAQDTLDVLRAHLVAQAQALREAAQALYQQLAQNQTAWSMDVARQLEVLQQQAAVLSEYARQLPRLEWEAYLQTMHQHNAELARRLMEEWEWEQDLRAQAARIRQLPEGPQRQQAIAQLRRQLEAAFDRKQQNRQAEIAQLERQIQRLRQRLDERARYRKHIVEQYLQDLLQGP
ncbi:hypothetical protein [Rhodothermus bifroesti]|nr:hypothetical protein [Rhodothermus bifroesti]GBD01218.1 hypothetical protein HRbin18_00938 [bacterium HR18]